MGFCTNCNQEVDSKFCPNCGKEVVESVKATKGNIASLIDELYTLRSGLSRLALENDKVKKRSCNLISKRKENQEQLKHKSHELSKCDLELSKCNSERERVSAQKTNENNANKKIRDEKSTKLNSLASTVKAWKISLRISIPFCIISLILSILYVIEFTNYGGVFGFDSNTMGALAFFGGFGLFACSIWLFASAMNYPIVLSAYKKSAEELKEFNKLILTDDEIVKHLNSKSEQFLNLTKRIKELEEKQDILQQEKTEILEFNYSSLENILLESKKASVAFYKEFYPAFLARFEKVLDPRDWCNLDLVIFILETGRADNLRDALIQVDGYRHTEAIVKAVSAASVAICRTITNESERLQRVIATNTDIINSRLIAMSKEQKALSDNLNNTVTKAIDKIELQNALLEKANTSSDALAKDVEAIRTYFVQ